LAHQMLSAAGAAVGSSASSSRNDEIHATRDFKAAESNV
jgi:hypothetical protein